MVRPEVESYPLQSEPAPDDALRVELDKRREDASERASFLERQASEWRQVERACSAALDTWNNGARI